tara:strand:- start:295 stop:798 length:504 start_codon:yes stop_codon:yes gene_type:complete
MSQFVEAETKVIHLEDILAALAELGINPELVEIHDEPIALSGWDEAAGQVAEVIIRKEDAGATFGDIGITKYKDGVKGQFFRFIADDTDCKPKQPGLSKHPEGTRLGCMDRKWGATRGGFLNHLAGRAGLIRAERELKRRGFRTRRHANLDAQGNIEGYRLLSTRSH